MYLLNGEIGSKLVTKNWNIVNDQSIANYSLRNQISYSAEVLKSNLSDYILVRGDINIIGRNLSTKITFKNHLLSVLEKMTQQKLTMLKIQI